MLKKICIFFCILIVFFENSNIAKAEYLSPEIVNGDLSYNLYDIIKLKNGTVQNITSPIFGKGTEFYINNNLIKVYENSLVYYLDGKYEPIELMEYSTNGYRIQLPVTTYNSISENMFYLTTKQIQSFFQIDVESKGIYYEIEETENNTPIGVDFTFLQNNITSLGYQWLGSSYVYFENDILNNSIFFFDDSIEIYWYNNTSEDIVDLILQALFPNSYLVMKGNLNYLNGEYDNRYIKSVIETDYIVLKISNIEFINQERDIISDKNDSIIITEDIY